jgi:capsular exopolysaccharide synthesis family protein
MSYIFEALQRAETERSGGAAPENVESVADLLQAVEQEIALKRAEGELAAATPAKTEDAPALQVTATPADLAVAAPVSTPAAAKVDSAAAGLFAQAKVLIPTVSADSRLVCLTDQGGLPAEKFRVLGLKLRHLREKRKLKRIVVTGTAPEEGKSLVAVNLALNQSRSKVLKTLLIDGDLRRPTVAGRFGFDSSLPGLSECLRGERPIAEVVYKLKGSGLWFLPAGRAPENPLELMQGGKLPELLEELGRFFDWIFIDTPPVVPVADTTFWMKQADGVLLVIREGVSEKKIVERAMSSFDPTVLLGVVVNSCSGSEHDNYYSRYGQAPAEAVAGAEN